MTISNT